MSSTPHVDRPAVEEDTSILRVENYRELVSAVLYLVSDGAENGVIQLHDYAGNVENDLTAACMEVTTQDPLGAYCVDYIKHEYTRVVSYYQATLDIHYRRSQEQVRSMVRVTGTGAIRTELRQALTDFESEVVLRVGYFAEDATFLEDLIRQTYYDMPETAFGCPSAEISLYPASGRERVVEILLTYPETAEELQRRKNILADAAKRITKQVESLASTSLLELPRERTARILAALWKNAGYDSEGGSSAYDALITGKANDEGMALAYLLLARQDGLTCRIVEGAREEKTRFWIELELTGESLYLDPAVPTATVQTAQEFFDSGYRWGSVLAEQLESGVDDMG